MGEAPARPFTPDTLAARRGCSGQHIRNLIKRGEIPCFEIGKLIRIPAAWVFGQERGETLLQNGAAADSGPARGSEVKLGAGRISRPVILHGGIVVR